MASKDRLDIAFVVLLALAFAALTSVASKSERISGTVLVPDAQWSATHQFSQYVLEDDDEDVYALDAPEGKLQAFAGQKVTIIGTVADDRIQVSSIFVPKECERTAPAAKHVARLSAGDLAGRR